MVNFSKNLSTQFTKSSLIISGLMLSLLWVLPLFACGCGVLITSSDNGAWTYGDDSLEQSFINFENGTEKLIISLDIKNTSRDAVLVIPIPADPDSVKADILSETPRFYGYDVSKRAQENLSHIRDALLVTQIYPIIPKVLNSLFNQSLGVKGAIPMPNSVGVPIGVLKGIKQDIIVYQHLEKNGMVAEVLSAANSDALYQYLTQKGLKVGKDSIPIFRDYINKSFSFVVSWINSSTIDTTARGLLMTFPADKIFYPLKPGSAYSGSGMEKTINVVGYVSPKLYSDIKDSTKVDYFYSTSGSVLKDFFSSDNGFGFTRIVVNAEPNKLTQDLYISENAPLKILNAQLINLHPFIYGLILLIIISFVSTYLVIRLLLSSALVKPNFIGLGIANCLTLVGTIIGSRIFLKEKRFKFVVLFSLTFVVLTLVSWFLLSTLYR